MKHFLIISFLIVCFAAVIFVIAQTENKYVFTVFEEKLLKAELNINVFQSQKFLDLKFFTELPVKFDTKSRDNPFSY